MDNKNISLFILEIILTNQFHVLDNVLTQELNDFIYKYYDSNKELFKTIYNIELLEECINNKWEILPQEIITQLIRPYLNYEAYINLLDEVGYEQERQINNLVQLFQEYYQELTELRSINPYQYYPKGFPRILQ